MLNKERGEKRLLLTPYPPPRLRPLLDCGEHFLDGGRLELFERFGLDLADPFPGDREILTHLLESAGLIVADSESESNHGLLSGCEILQDTVELMRHLCTMHMRIRRHCVYIWQQLSEFRSAVPDRML